MSQGPVCGFIDCLNAAHQVEETKQLLEGFRFGVQGKKGPKQVQRLPEQSVSEVQETVNSYYRGSGFRKRQKAQI